MKKSLIFCPAGVAIQTKDHWRRKAPDSLYDIYLINYNDYKHDKSSYDTMVSMKALKWEMAKKLLPTIDLDQYEYVGFVDDDLVFTSADLNASLNLAKQIESNLFQLSLDRNSFGHYRILFNNSHIKYAVTNFIEIMAPFIHTSKLKSLMAFWDLYDPRTGWGLDLILCNILKSEAHVFHEVSMHHPHRKSTYDKTEAITEQDMCLRSAYPSYMKNRYNEDVIPGSYDEPRILKRELR